ncbi:MAG: hypothetical protein HY400_06210 [Elusimicrobia bacterium]|nr:hypothetical protein [Elusimicrobiota bacterium]
MTNSKLLEILDQIRLLRSPKRKLATFGDTRIQYHLLSSVEDLPDRCRLRQGNLLAFKPKILTLEALKERFQGFGSEAREYVDWLREAYWDVFRALEYSFKNEMSETRVLRQKPKVVAEKIQQDLDGREIAEAAVLMCPDAGWQLALMKFILDETRRSFPFQLREMEDRNLFNPEIREETRKRQEVEGLLKAASRDRSLIKDLGEKLHRYGLFQEYEDRFFSLI